LFCYIVVSKKKNIIDIGQIIQRTVNEVIGATFSFTKEVKLEKYFLVHLLTQLNLPRQQLYKSN